MSFCFSATLTFSVLFFQLHPESIYQIQAFLAYQSVLAYFHLAFDLLAIKGSFFLFTFICSAELPFSKVLR